MRLERQYSASCRPEQLGQTEAAHKGHIIASRGPPKTTILLLDEVSSNLDFGASTLGDARVQVSPWAHLVSPGLLPI